MITAVANAHRLLDVPIADALAMASANPADFLGIADDIGRIAPGRVASLLAIDRDWSIRRRWIAGIES